MEKRGSLGYEAVYSRRSGMKRGREGRLSFLGKLRKPLMPEMRIIAGGLAILLAAQLLYAIFYGAVRWALLTTILLMAGWIAVGFIFDKAQALRALFKSEQKEARSTGSLRDFASFIKRGQRGIVYSQMIVASRLSDAFMEKVRISRGLTYEDISSMKGDPNALRRFIKDDEICIFIEETERNVKNWPDALRRRGLSMAVFPTGDFLHNINDVVRRMEAWR